MTKTQPKIYPNLIGSNWQTLNTRGIFENINPACPNEIVGIFPKASRDDARQAIEAARAASPHWAGTPAPLRAAVLDRASHILAARAEAIATALTREEGKTLAESRAEVQRASDILRYYGGEGWRSGGQVLPGASGSELLYTRREPLGVVSVITPWNFPIAIPAWKIAPALAYGNTVVFKPSEDAPLSAFLLVEALLEAGLPPGAINYLTGDGPTLGAELTGNPGVDGISFTGSQAVGAKIYQAAIQNMTRVQLEMGGKNALVVLKDADLETAVDLAVKGGFGLTGQACTATSRVIVEEEIADAFVAALSRAAGQLKIGNGLEAGVQMGPLVNRRQLETVRGYLAIGKKEGAQLLPGSEGESGPGYFAQPAVFDHVQPSMQIAQEEIFGPVVAVLRASGLEDAIEKTNAVRFGLSAAIVTNNLKAAFAFANRVEAGVVKINQPTTGLALNAPFGGFKQSSSGAFKEMGQAAVDFYTRTKTVYVNPG